MTIVIDPTCLKISLIPLDNPTHNSTSRITLDEWIEMKINEVIDKHKEK